MPITHQTASAATQPPEGAVDVPMNQSRVSENVLYTTGVADCLVMILWDSTQLRGALAHISWPAAASTRAPMPQVDDRHEVRILNHVAGHRDHMLKTLKSQPGDVDVLLWRGHGFGNNPHVTQPNIVRNLSWSHFRGVQDLMAWGDGQGGYSIPYADSERVIFDPGTGTASFARRT